MKPSERRKARRLAVQAIYSWQLTDNNVADVEHEFLTEQSLDGVDVAYFRELLAGVTAKVAQIDELLKPHLDRDFSEVSPVEKAIVRLATFELTFKKMCLLRLPLMKVSNLRKPSVLMIVISSLTVY